MAIARTGEFPKCYRAPFSAPNDHISRNNRMKLVVGLSFSGITTKLCTHLQQISFLERIKGIGSSQFYGGIMYTIFGLYKDGFLMPQYGRINARNY